MKPITPLSSQSPQPLYKQIKEALRKRILEGEYKPHERLPSESELMVAFGVSRITIRQALRDLHGEGLVFSAQGKGTFVSRPKAVQSVYSLEGFDEAMSAQGYQASARVLGIQEIKGSPDVISALQLVEGDSVVEVLRVRFLNREPMALERSFFPMDIGRRLFGLDLSQDIFPILENVCGMPLGEARISIEAGLVDPEREAQLDLETGQPVLRVERLTSDRDGRPIDFEYLTLHGDSFKYQFRVERKREQQQ